MMEDSIILSVDSKVIHVDFQPFLPQHIHEDMIHECLECGGVVQNPKNMTIGLNSPMGVMKAAFHWFSFRMWMLLYSQ